MNRSGPLTRRTPLKPGRLLARKAPSRATAPTAAPRARLRPVSRKAAPRRRARAVLVARLVSEGVRCEICPELARHGIHLGCPGTIGGIHERRKRASAGSTVNPVNLIPCCNLSNDAIESDLRVMRLGRGWLILRPRDPEWVAAAARNDRHTPPPAVTVNHCTWCNAAYMTIPPSGLLTCGHAANVPVPDTVNPHVP